MIDFGRDGCCKDCTERHEACWGTCERYLEMKAKAEKLRKKAQDNRLIKEYTLNAVYKSKRRKGIK